MARPGFLLLVYYYIILFLFFFHSCMANEMKELRRTSPVYAMLTNADLLNSTQCGKELKDFREAIDQRLLWSLKVIDASGEPKPGFIYGNNYWLGSRSQCKDANNKNLVVLSEEVLRNISRYRRIEDEFPPYQVNYFVANFRHNSTLQYHILPEEDLIILGMCLPASCSNDQLFILLEIVFKNRTLVEGELYLADFTLVEVKDLIDDHRWLLSGTFITMTIVVILTLLLMIIGTVYDVLIYQRRMKEFNLNLQDCSDNNTKTIDNMEMSSEDTKDQLEKFKSQSFLYKIFQAFSVYSNTKRIFSYNDSDNSVSVIHGLRFLTMVWIILIHVFLYSRDYYDNKLMVSRILDYFFAEIINKGPFSVDTFFCFGGFLVAYLYLKTEINKDKRKPYNHLNAMKSFFLIVLKRFIRLTPTYMAILGLVEINTTWYSKTSLFYITERSHETCPKYWWRNILYIQNLFSRKDMCMSWSWYLANDMQFFVIVTFLLFLSSMYFKLAASLLGLLFILSTILTGYIAYIYDYVPTIDKQYSLAEVIYFPPWVRIGPYLIGVIAAYILIKLNNKLLWKKKTIIFFWILISSCNLLVLFGLYQKNLSILTVVVYAALSRSIWAIGIAWLLIVCCTNNGGIVNSILSWKVWIPLSKLTYVVYLINPILIISVNLFSETAPHIEVLANTISFLGYVVISYICSYVLSLMFEAPYIILMKEVINYLSIKT